MTKLESAFFDFGYFETLANQQTIIHKLDPRAKLLTTLVFLITVLSFDPYDLSKIIPFFLYPMIMARAGNIPVGYLAKKIAIVLPFVVLIGIFNPLFDQSIMMKVGQFTISGGWLSFFSILLRCILTVFAALILIATTGFYTMCTALERMRVPSIFVVQLLFVYRYLFVLIEEASRMTRARTLRTFSRQNLDIKVWSSLIGNLLLRTIDRAHRIHLAMLSRGFDGKILRAQHYKISMLDLGFFFGWTLVFILMRIYNLSTLAGNILTKFML